LDRVVVLGAGAVGSLFGARLAAAGVPVLLVGRRAHVEAVRARGLVVEGVAPGTYRPDAATEVPRGIRASAVLVTVKSFDLASALDGLARAVPPTPTALLGNGLGLEAIAREALQGAGWPAVDAWLVRGVHTVPATLLGPGRVRASGTGEVVLPTPQAAGVAARAVEEVSTLLTRAGIPVRTSPEFDLELWRKAAVNAAINPVTAARGVPNGALLDGPARDEAKRLLEEAVAVARGSGVDLSLATARADLDRVVRATAENRSSMLQDVERGRPTELDAISGEILRRGAKLGLELPATARAVEAVRRKLAKPRRATQPS
jgi:2-dehydropantoate 2-reductase